MGKRKAGGGGGDDGRKRSSYFSTNSKASLPQKSRGFLISCIGGKEYLAAKEAGNVLTEFYEKLHPESVTSSKAPAKDIAAAIADEVADLKAGDSQLFTYHKTNIHGLAYLTMQDSAEGPGPVELVTAMAEEIKKTKECRTRLCIRFTPVERVCTANLPEIGACAKALIAPHFPAGEDAAPVRFAVAYEHRASKEFDRIDVINQIVNQVPQPPHKVDLNNAEKTIMVQLLKNTAALSVVSNYKQLAKFNVRELSTTDEEQQKAVKAASGKQEEQQAARAEEAAPPAEEAAAGNGQPEEHTENAEEAAPSAAPATDGPGEAAEAVATAIADEQKEDMAVAPEGGTKHAVGEAAEGAGANPA